MRPRAILLDLDDTILDDSSLVHDCWREACAGSGASICTPRSGGHRRRHPHRVALVLGRCRPASNRAPRARSRAARGRQHRIDRARHRRSTPCRRDRRCVPPSPRCRHGAAAEAIHTVPVASRLSGRRLALLTNGAEPAQRKKVVRFGLADFFEVILIEGEMGSRQAG